jgi:hypothetical protein
MISAHRHAEPLDFRRSAARAERQRSSCWRSSPVLLFAVVGVYRFFSASQAGTGGKALPLGPPLIH